MAKALPPIWQCRSRSTPFRCSGLRYIREYPVEKDARRQDLPDLEGRPEIQRLVISRAISGERRPLTREQPKAADRKATSHIDLKGRSPGHGARAASSGRLLALARAGPTRGHRHPDESDPELEKTAEASKACSRSDGLPEVYSEKTSSEIRRWDARSVALKMDVTIRTGQGVVDQVVKDSAASTYW